MVIDYIENDKNKGINYDWNFLKKEYKKLKCPNNVYNPCSIPFERSTYQMILSERSTGKTTNILLLGMLMNKYYGTIIQYIRSQEDMIMNKTINELFKTIREFNYIEKITDGKYNNCIYKARKWHYCKVDDGEVLEICPQHFMFCLSIDKSENYKSSYNCPTGDFIVFDEFIGKRYRMNEFVYFLDLIATIRRDRICCKVVLLANNIDKHSEYFNEFEVYDEIQTLEYGQKEIVTTDLGTPIFIEWVADRKDKKEKKIMNTLFFGFKNTKINAITGGDWNTNNYPHFPEKMTPKVLYRGLYIDYHDKLLALDLVEYEDIGICINVHRAYKTYEDSIIYSLKQPLDKRYRYYLGMGDRIDNLIIQLVKAHKIRFQNNACGTMFFNHFNQKDARKGGY